MTPFPLPLEEIFGHWGSYIVYLGIGFAFGFVLEMAGFGKSTKLAAQFYFKEWTVLKVMFGAIIVAMVLIFAATGLGLLDYNLIWVNPTYLWPGIVGGLVMGVGFIIGGFCPGTSLVSAATGKLDGVFFVLGVFFGIFIFGESVSLFEDFWHSSYLGRYTLMELFNTSTGVIALGVVLMALAAFFVGEYAEKIIGGMDWRKAPRWRFGAAGTVLMGAVVVLVIGQPTNADRWDWVKDESEDKIANREVQVHPGELLETIEDTKLIAYMIDVRSEADYNRFHILDAHHVPLADLLDEVPVLNEQPANTVFVLMSNDEAAATDAWRLLVAESVPNVYILEGGINNWLNTFAEDDFKAKYALASYDEDQLGYAFTAALGSRYAAANPNHDVFARLEFPHKIELDIKRGPSGGGCG